MLRRLVCVHVLYILVGELALAGHFQPHVDYGTGTDPKGVGVADFNHDGNVDLVLPNYLSDTVSVLLGNGDGTFQANIQYRTGPGPNSVAIGDLNADDKPDLVVMNSNSSTVSVLLGNGDGTFQTHVDYARGTGSFPCCSLIALSDFNLDGALDLVAANYGPDFGAGTVSILLGNGNGTFQTQVQYGAGVNPVGVMVGDFNRDNDPDLAVLNNNPPFGISILLGNGDGSFQKAVLYTAGSNSRVGVVADLDSDGNLDLVVANWLNNNVSILLGNGDGSFQHHVEFPTGTNPNALVSSDLDGDGKFDLAMANNGSSDTSVLLGNGDGTFKNHVDFAAGPGATGLAVADVNGDGAPDLAVANEGNNTVSVLLQARCEASIHVLGKLYTSGSMLSAHIHLAHHRSMTVTVPWEVSVVDANGRVIVKHTTLPQTFKPGDVVDTQVNLLLPKNLASGGYSLRLAIIGMAGTGGATTSFLVGSAE